MLMTLDEIRERLKDADCDLTEALLLLRIRQLHAELAQAEYEYARFRVEQS